MKIVKKILSINLKKIQKSCLITIFAIAMLSSLKNVKADTTYYSSSAVAPMAPIYSTATPIMTDSTWLLTPYLTASYVIGSANIKSLVSNYDRSLKTAEMGLMIGTGFLINKSYGLGISFFAIKGIKKDVINDQYISKSSADMYIINVDAKLILPFTFYSRLHFYAIGGVGAIFASSNYIFKEEMIPSSYVNKSNQKAFSASIGAGAEFNLTERFLLNAEFRKFFMLKTKAISDFWLFSLGLTARF